MTIYEDAYLTTMEAVREQLGADALTDADDDTLIWQFISAASAMVHQFCRRSFVPYVQTRYYDAQEPMIDGDLLRLDEDLLEATTVTNGDSTTVSTSDYVLRNRNIYPYWGIKLKESSSLTWTYSGSDYEDAISIAGIWGFHESYGTAWVDTGDTVQDASGINASVQTITVTDANGKDGRYRTRFEVGKLLKIDDEFIKVVAVDTGAETLTVLRGALGSTAATHANGATIYSWAVQRNIEQAVISLVAWLYRNKSTAGDEIQFMSGAKIITNKAPSNIRQVLNAYVRHRA